MQPACACACRRGSMMKTPHGYTLVLGVHSSGYKPPYLERRAIHTVYHLYTDKMASVPSAVGMRRWRRLTIARRMQGVRPALAFAGCLAVLLLMACAWSDSEGLPERSADVPRRLLPGDVAASELLAEYALCSASGWPAGTCVRRAARHAEALPSRVRRPSRV